MWRNGMERITQDWYSTQTATEDEVHSIINQGGHEAQKK